MILKIYVKTGIKRMPFFVCLFSIPSPTNTGQVLHLPRIFCRLEYNNYYISVPCTSEVKFISQNV